MGPADHMRLADRIAIFCAGATAQAVSGYPGHELATFRDNFEIMKLLEANGYTEENGALAVCVCGAMKIAEAIVKDNLAKVLTLADRLTEHGQIEAANFCCRAEAASVSTADTPQRRKKWRFRSQRNCVAACKNSF